MGLGDEIMASGEVRHLRFLYPNTKFIIGDGKRSYWSEIFDNNPYIIRGAHINKYQNVQWVYNYKGHRPYLKYDTEFENERYVWNQDHKAKKGEIYLTDYEINKAHEFINQIKAQTKNKKIIYIEPNRKIVKGFENRDWGFEKWQILVDNLKNDYVFVQGTFGNQKKLMNVFNINGLSFRMACAFIKHLDLFVGTEGGFHHAAAALDKNAVVIFGGFISPSVTGYDFHSNIYVDNNNSPCGKKFLCEHCVDCMKKISVESVINLINKNLS